MAKQLDYGAFAERKNADAMVIAMPNGESFTVSDPALWPDSISALAAKGDNVGVARGLIGDDNYDRFVAAGGVANALIAMIGDAQGIEVGESSASSD